MKRIKKLGILLVDIIIFLAIVALLGLSLAFVYNFFFIWLMPSTKEIGILEAMGASLLISLLHMFINFWVSRFLQIKAAKAVEGLQMVYGLAIDLASLKQELREKDIL
ncbi:hypothetical protein [Paenibacillus illinoisensis]|uniref:hypothetical protein n=1 Tax=Paenibacillus illinoisensis TaxID=59845 RepID=UPI00301B5297